MNLNATQIARYTRAAQANAEKYAAGLNEAMTRFEITTPRRVAAFLATLAVESQNLSKVEEDLYYKNAERLVSIYPRAFSNVLEAKPYTRNPEGLSGMLYDGFHGRGLIQLTWKRNYLLAGFALGEDYVANPALVCEPRHAALTAGWYWHNSGCNAPADAGDMSEVTRLVNGPRRMHLAERTEQYRFNAQLLEAA